MILPGSYLLALILAIVCIVCWSSWANTFRIAGPKWRFELFYFDFAIGMVIAAGLAAVTFGMLGIDGFTVLDDVSLAGKRQEVMAILAGFAFNLGNIMIVAAMSIAGMSMAFPVGISMALISAGAIDYALHRTASPLLLAAGSITLAAAAVFDALAWRRNAALKAHEAQATAATLPAQAAAPKTGKTKKTSKKRAASGRAIVLAVAGGLAMGFFYPVLRLSQEAENGVGPYTAAFMFSLGVAFSTFVYNLFFMNIPVQGSPVEFGEYFQGRAKQHLWGIVGGAAVSAGLVANLVASRAPANVQISPALGLVVCQAAPALNAVWGIAVWKEFAGADNSVRLMLGGMFLALVLGTGTLALAQVH
jgi:glucose uptake protein